MSRRVAALVMSLGTSACLGNQSGNIAATATGDVSTPAVRGSPLAALRDVCGDGTITAAGAAALVRTPYLQQVTSNSALVGAVTASPGALRVELEDPSKATPTLVEAAAEPTTYRSAGETLMWASLGALEPGKVYCYTASNERDVLADRVGFRTAPRPDSTEAVRFLAFGDSGGGGSDQYALLEQMYGLPYELMIHVGDLAYGSGTAAEIEDTVFKVYSELLASIPFFPTTGNHDYETAGGAPFREAFALPGSSGERWYSFDWGRVHFVALDTEASYQEQAEWLDADLAASTLPWKVVYMHKPPYSSGEHGSDSQARALLSPVFERHGVQVVFAGHDHDYERTTPQNGVTYVVTGGGGIGTRPVGTSSFTAFSEDVISFVYGEATDDTLILHAIDATGVEFDSVVLHRS